MLFNPWLYRNFLTSPADENGASQASLFGFQCPLDLRAACLLPRTHLVCRAHTKRSALQQQLASAACDNNKKWTKPWKKHEVWFYTIFGIYHEILPWIANLGYTMVLKTKFGIIIIPWKAWKNTMKTTALIPEGIVWTDEFHEILRIFRCQEMMQKLMYIAIENGPVEIVSFPMTKWWSFHSFLLTFTRGYLMCSKHILMGRWSMISMWLNIYICGSGGTMFSKKLMSGDNIIPFVNGMENCWKMRGPWLDFLPHTLW